MRTAENVERALMKSICPLLPDFVATCDMVQMSQMMHIISKYIECYKEDLELVLPLLEALRRILHLPLSCWSRALIASGGGMSSPVGMLIKANSFGGKTVGAGRLLEELSDAASPAAERRNLRSGSVGSDLTYLPLVDNAEGAIDRGSPTTEESSLRCLPPDSPGLGAVFQSCMAEGGNGKGGSPSLRVSDTYRYHRPLLGSKGQSPTIHAGVFESACDLCTKSLIGLVEAPTTEFVLLRAVLGVLLDIATLGKFSSILSTYFHSPTAISF